MRAVDVAVAKLDASPQYRCEIVEKIGAPGERVFCLCIITSLVEVDSPRVVVTAVTTADGRVRVESGLAGVPDQIPGAAGAKQAASLLLAAAALAAAIEEEVLAASGRLLLVG